MGQQRPHQQDVSLTGQDGVRRHRPQRQRLAGLVRAWNHLQGTVFLRDVIEVDACRQHGFQHVRWRLDVRHARLGRGPLEFTARQPIVADRDGQIFVPGQGPRLFGRLVEKKHADQAVMRAEKAAEDRGQVALPPHRCCRRPQRQDVPGGINGAPVSA